MIVKILPVLRYWIVLLWLVLVPVVAVCIVPVGIGSSLPTCILAGRLSVARTVGEERTLTRESLISALMKARTTLLLPITPLRPAPNWAIVAPFASEGVAGTPRDAPTEPKGVPKIVAAAPTLLKISYSMPKDRSSPSVTSA